ncbi:SPFH domain / Band 7 family protein [compost metagenome]
MNNYRVTFLGNVDGTVEASTRIRMPQGEQFLKIAREYRTPENFISTAVAPAVKETLQTTASLMTADDYFAGARSEFGQYYEDQLRNGQYVVKRKEVEKKVPQDKDNKDPSKLLSGAGDDGEQKRTEFVTEKETDKSGRELRKAQQFVGLGVEVVEARITNILPNEQFRARMVKVQTAQAELAVARQNRLKEEEEKLLVTARGQKEVEQEKQATLRTQIKLTTDAETEKMLALTRGSQAEESAKISKRTAQELLDKAKIDAQATKTSADAEAYALKVVLEADGALDKKLAAAVQMNKDTAEAIAQAPVSQFSMGGTGSGSRAGAVDEFMTLMNAQNMKSLSLDMGIKK